MRRLARAFAVVELDTHDGVGAEQGGFLLQRPERGVLVAHRFVRIDDPDHFRGSRKMLAFENEDLRWIASADGARARIGGRTLARRVEDRHRLRDGLRVFVLRLRVILGVILVRAGHEHQRREGQRAHHHFQSSGGIGGGGAGGGAGT